MSRLVSLLFFIFAIPNATSLKGTQPAYDSFPDEWCYLNELADRANDLSAHSNAKSQKLIKSIFERTQEDPSITSLTCNDAFDPQYLRFEASDFAPYDFNRAGKNIPNCFMSGSMAHMKRQNFLLFECPKSIEELENFVAVLANENIKVIVSLTEQGLPRDRLHDFWQQEVLEKLSLRWNWEITNLGSILLATESKEKSQSAQVVETLLLLTNGWERRYVTHLHYDGWKDRHCMPSQQLFNVLLERIHSLSPSRKKPIAIHCRAGIGRTGITAVTYYLEREVDAQLLSGIPLERIRINIPETIYLFRKQRKGLANEVLQLPTIYIALSNYYQQCKLRQENEKSSMNAAA